VTATLLGRPGGFTTTATGRPGLRERLRRVIDYRRILWLLVRRDLKVRYAGSALGYVWSVLEPLLMSLVYWLVFSYIMSRNVGYAPYIVFLVFGQMMWAWFNGGVTGSLRALQAQAQMVRQSNVPREVWVIRVAVSKGIEFVFSLPVIGIFALCYLKAPNWRLVYLPLSMVMCFFLVLGLGFILAPLTVLVRDVERIVPIVLRVLFYASPILYSVKDVPAKIHFALSLNPMTGVLVIARAGFFPTELSGEIPKVTKRGTEVHDAAGHVVMRHIDNWPFVWHSAIAITVIFTIGVFVFARLERPVLKEI
jgi:ABC-type polysaccharide/polyol phosphate export permease